MDREGIDPEDDTRGIGNSPLLVSLMPFALLLVLYVGWPAYGDAAFQTPPDIVGIPLGMAGLAIALGWAVLGVYLVSEATSFGAALILLLVCTLPAAVGVVIAPWVASGFGAGR